MGEEGERVVADEATPPKNYYEPGRRKSAANFFSDGLIEGWQRDGV